MKRKIFFILCLLLPFCFGFGFGYTKSEPQPRIFEILDKYNQIILNIKDATADLTLDSNLFLFGCSGIMRQQGKLYFKAPDKLRADTTDHNTYFVRNNNIRKIDGEGNKFYIYLLYSLDYSVGFNANLISANFYLSLLKDSPDEIIMRGIPKPEVLKNAKEVLIYFDPKTNLLNKFEVLFTDKRFNGTIYIYYQKIDELWVPSGFQGKTAVELPNSIMVGMGLNFTIKNIKINTGLSDQFFNPGF